MKTPWDFVEKYYPNYENSNEILLANDLSKIVNKESEPGDDSDKYFQKECYGSINLANDKYRKVHIKIYEKAIQEFINQLPEEEVEYVLPITKEDVISIAKKSKVDLSEEQVNTVLEYYKSEEEQDPTATWDIIVQNILFNLNII